MVRAGLGIYGLRPAPGLAPEVALRPAMRVVSAVSYVRRYPAGTKPSYGRRRPLPAASTVATVPIRNQQCLPKVVVRGVYIQEFVPIDIYNSDIEQLVILSQR